MEKDKTAIIGTVYQCYTLKESNFILNNGNNGEFKDDETGINVRYTFIPYNAKKDSVLH